LAERPGDLIRVALARNQAEAEFIQGLLLQERIPSVVRRTAGFDVPDFLSAGPRDILVARSRELDAREVLLQAEVIDPHAEQPPATVAPLRLLMWLLVALGLGALLVWLISLVAS
jgi:hypothetical protein